MIRKMLIRSVRYPVRKAGIFAERGSVLLVSSVSWRFAEAKTVPILKVLQASISALGIRKLNVGGNFLCGLSFDRTNESFRSFDTVDQFIRILRAVERW